MSFLRRGGTRALFAAQTGGLSPMRTSARGIVTVADPLKGFVGDLRASSPHFDSEFRALDASESTYTMQTQKSGQSYDPTTRTIYVPPGRKMGGGVEESILHETHHAFQHHSTEMAFAANKHNSKQESADKALDFMRNPVNRTAMEVSALASGLFPTPVKHEHHKQAIGSLAGQIGNYFNHAGYSSDRKAVFDQLENGRLHTASRGKLKALGIDVAALRAASSAASKD